MVLDELLGPEGNSFYLKKASKYVSSEEKLTFLALSARLAATGQVLVGYKDLNTGASVINPHKLEALNWGNYVLIVMSNAERVNQQEQEEKGDEKVKGPATVLMEPSSPTHEGTHEGQSTQMLSHHMITQLPPPLVSTKSRNSMLPLSSTQQNVSSVSHVNEKHRCCGINIYSFSRFLLLFS